MELANDIYHKVIALSIQGDQLAAEGFFAAAVTRYEQALGLLPEPISRWEAAAWLYVAIGDAYYWNGQYDMGLHAFFTAQKDSDDPWNPFLCARIGECFYERKQFQKAQEYLLRAYLLDGTDVFSDVDAKYLHLIEPLIAAKYKN